MLYLKAINDQVVHYPYSLGQLRKDNSRTTFPKQPNLETLRSFNMFPVTEVTPTLAEGEKLVKTWTPTLVSGEWILLHVAIPKTAEDLESELAVKWANLREQRNKLLGETDWNAFTDVTMSDEMTAYRQALRDLPESVDINNIIYPDKP